jgi:hypothetical protein
MAKQLKILTLEDLFLYTIYRVEAYYSFGKISKASAKYVYEQLNMDIAGFELRIDTNHLRHFYDRHYDEIDGHHFSIRFSDFRKLLQIVNTPTQIKNGNVKNRIVFKKNYPNGKYDLVVEIDRRNKILSGKSFRINT